MSAGAEVKLKPFEVRKDTRKDCRQHKRAGDGPSWTPTELYRRDRALRLNNKMEGCKAVTPEFSEGYDAIQWQSEEERAAGCVAAGVQRTVEKIGDGRTRIKYGDATAWKR